MVGHEGHGVELDAREGLLGPAEDAEDEGIEGLAGSEQVASLEDPRDDVKGDIGRQIARVMRAGEWAHAVVVRRRRPRRVAVLARRLLIHHGQALSTKQARLRSMKFQPSWGLRLSQCRVLEHRLFLVDLAPRDRDRIEHQPSGPRGKIARDRIVTCSDCSSSIWRLALAPDPRFTRLRGAGRWAAMQATERLIVALDVPERERALALARKLMGAVGMVKVGLEGFVAHGPALVTSLVQQGHRVFLDLKLNDIPRTVSASAREAARLGADLLTVHASGGGDMMRAAVEAAAGTRVIAVTLLTSLDDEGAAAVGFAGGVGASVERLGRLAMTSGAHGLVCSAHELKALAPLGGLRVVPGIRTRAMDADDQKRTASAAQAVALGATYIVVGRPIIDAPDPRAAAEAIVAGMKAAPG